ncbi:MAG TPA: peptidoglycan-binding domain-containing protein [Nocardioides sp.]|nr:peptidoglycan-binding domain-containing protein [Nocardioides sp.]
MRGRQRLVLVLAAVLGVAGGVTTAFVAPGTSEPGAGPAEVNDPLRLGIPQVSLPSCTDEAVLVLGEGDSAAALTPAVSDAGDGARYLRTDESCETLWDTDDDVPQYVVYRGPFDSEAEPCRESLADGVSTVTNLSAGNEMFVQCACVLPTAELYGVVPPDPEVVDQEPAPVPWVHMLQEMLSDLGGPDVELTGVYDEATIERVRDFQRNRTILPADGKVGVRTWGALRDELCGTYDF